MECEWGKTQYGWKLKATCSADVLRGRRRAEALVAGDQGSGQLNGLGSHQTLCGSPVDLRPSVSEQFSVFLDDLHLRSAQRLGSRLPVSCEKLVPQMQRREDAMTHMILSRKTVLPSTWPSCRRSYVPAFQRSMWSGALHRCHGRTTLKWEGRTYVTTRASCPKPT